MSRCVCKYGTILYMCFAFVTVQKWHGIGIGTVDAKFYPGGIIEMRRKATPKYGSTGYHSGQ
jgi:hypothetical protein